MINVIYKEDIIRCLASLISYGINNNYSYSFIEENILCSSFINNLENNKFDINKSYEEYINEIYGINILKADISYKALFISESYINLFFNSNKSFEYIFLYWPLDIFIGKYNIYHEMDYSNLESDFYNIIKKEPLLKRLAKVKGIYLKDISKLTSININTINKYARDDKYINNASINNIYKLAKLFNVKENIFILNIGVYLDDSIYLNSNYYIKYRNYLGFYYASYFDKRIIEEEYKYDDINHQFKSLINNKNIKILILKEEDIDINIINKNSNKDTYLIIFIDGYYNKGISYFNCLRMSNPYEILIIRNEYVSLIKKDVDIEISETIYTSLLIKAKENI